jgi:hypothetical protein
MCKIPEASFQDVSEEGMLATFIVIVLCMVYLLFSLWSFFSKHVDTLSGKSLGLSPPLI